MCLANDGMRALICRKTATSLTSTALVTFREHVAIEALTSGEVRFYGGSQQEAASYRYGNGSVITVGGLDKATRIMSSEYDCAYVQEATELTEGDWEAITTRLRNGRVSFQQLMADCNPDAPHHWLKRRCDRGATRMLNCQHEDNPRLYCMGCVSVSAENVPGRQHCEHAEVLPHWTMEGSSYIARLDALTGVRKQRLRYGLWAAAEGLVYENFEPAVHISDRFNFRSHPPQSWPRYLSVDFGYTNPFVAQWWVEDPDGRLYMYKEIYKTRTLVEDHAVQIRKLMKTQHGPEPEFTFIVCDHDAEDRATLERHLGRSTVPAHKDVKPGIEAVQSRLRRAGDGKPRLYICRDALVERDAELDEAKKPCSTSDEIVEYIWDPTALPSRGGALREAPLKRNDHGADAMRYLVSQIDLVGRPRVRFL